MLPYQQVFQVSKAGPARLEPVTRQQSINARTALQLPDRRAWPDSARVSVDGRHLKVDMRRRGALAFAIQSVPIKYLSSHQYIGSTIGTQEIPPYDPVRTYGMTVSKPEQFASVMGRHIGTLESRYHIKEDDLGIAATTPVLGQYVPTFGWPDDN